MPELVVNFCQNNKEGEIFGVELSDCVDEAYENTREFLNAHIIQADVMNLPFQHSIFDLVFSEGVLHHTPDTKAALIYLINYLKAGGEMAIYVYKAKGPLREFCDDYIRQYSTKLSPKECWQFCEAITKLGKALSETKIEFEVPEDIPILKIKAGRYNLQRFFYWNILKCFWNE